MGNADTPIPNDDHHPSDRGVIARLKSFRFNLLNSILHTWIRPTVLGAEAERVGPSRNQQICYVMPWKSLADLLIVDQACTKAGLPRPFDPILTLGEERAFFFLGHPEGFLGRKSYRNQSERMTRLLRCQPEAGDDILLIPVSLFWGHQPDREKSLFKLLLSENWTVTNRFKKLLAIIFHPNHILVQFAPPYSLRELIASEQDPEKQHRKLGRLLRSHFNQQRQAIIGPDLSHRRTLITNMLTSTPVQTAISNASQIGDLSYENAQKQASRYAHEIASHQSYRVIRFFHVILSWLWHRLYDGIEINNIDVVKELAQRHELIYVPCHRSHIDYLLLSYVLYHNGLTPPHIAAGINLNMPVVGSLLRRAGAFFMRRSFRGDDLYKAVFDEYLHLMFTRGYSVEYFIEGGRSRTGRTLKPRTGMLSMTMRSFARNSSLPIVFMPVYFGYERILEVSTYLDELQGKPKQQESLADIFRVLGSLKNEFGRVSVNFGEPLQLHEHMDDTLPHWRNNPIDAENFSSSCNELAKVLASRLNSACAVNPVNLSALALLSTPRQAMDEQRLLQQLSILKHLALSNPYSSTVSITDKSPTEILDYAANVAQINRVEHSFATIVRLDPRITVILTYYANNIVHLYCLYSMICRWYRQQPAADLQNLNGFLKLIYPFLKAEYFLHWSASELPQVVQTHIEALQNMQLLIEEATDFTTPAPDSSEYACLTDIADFVAPTLERYFILVSLLEADPDSDISAIQSAASQVAERLSALYGTNSPDYFDPSLFSTFMSELTSEGYIVRSENETQLTSSFAQLSTELKSLLESDIQYNVLQAVKEVRREGLQVT